jgi:acetolactate synthase-1/2/3 large subunit
VQFATADYTEMPAARTAHYQPRTTGDAAQIARMVEMMETAERPLFYTGGGVINSGPRASQLLREFVAETGFPITSTLMGLGSYPASGENWLGMLGMHGLYEANLSMHGCDLMLNIGARFDDRITGRIPDFSPKSKKVHVDIDPSSINKVIRTDVGIIGDVAEVLAEALRQWRARGSKVNKEGLAKWWAQINEWRAVKCLTYKNSTTVIKPQYALERLEALTKGMDRYITTEVGQHHGAVGAGEDTRQVDDLDAGVGTLTHPCLRDACPRAASRTSSSRCATFSSQPSACRGLRGSCQPAFRPRPSRVPCAPGSG